MIVADTNIISYLLLPTEYSEQASQLFRQNSFWIAPQLWRSEFRSVLSLYLRQNVITLSQALAIQEEAEALMADREYALPSVSVLQLVANSSCSAYDCEFVALAKQLAIPLLTQDKKLLREFPADAISLDAYLSRG